MFDPESVGYAFRPGFDKMRMARLLNEFEGQVKRHQDRKLAIELRHHLLQTEPPTIPKKAFERLARWCKTGTIYGDGMDVAQKISRELSGRLIDRDAIGV